jgi:hypothetical protein
MSIISKFIYWYVFAFVFFVWFNVISLLRFPHLRVFVYALEPKGLWLGMWNRVRYYSLIAILILSVVLLMFYGLWVLIKTFMPNFPIPLRSIFLAIPPFKQLEKSGMFAFIGGLLKALFGRTKFITKMGRVGKVFADFIARNTDVVLGVLGIKKAFTGDAYAEGEAYLPQSEEERKRRNAERQRENVFDKSDDRKMDDELMQCIEENTAHVTEDMSKFERSMVEQRNSVNRILCKARRIQAMTRTLTGKL